MRIANFVASFSSVALASALVLPVLSTPLDSTATTSMPVVPVSITSIPVDSISTASVPVVSVPITSITVVSTTNVANSPEITKLLLGLDAIDKSITTVKSSIDKSDNNLDVVEICKNFSSNGIINLAINDVLLQTQSLNVTVTSDASESIADAFKTEIAPHYQELLQLLEGKMGDLKSTSLHNSDLLNTLLEGDNWLDVISSGLQLGLANQLIIALIKVLDPAYRNVAYDAGGVIQKALDSCVQATTLQ
ncbi:hypothetical protein CGRA01v4_13726 [Colletotrichum graminicola]|uniref:Cell wall protein n=1 Tax=Colletotrichum graminicola (strain M1.001 / M2 / FGSC 10212) TaxID=645133 RepID=E3R0Y9_COLGM|nr:uncharacterized protein GLRG_11923 [Colletotrichum graminicola M1.001]EFQ36777.1 hypothetical protein GLRG_11923 [Colletotrichum graminicola M1.001]WDK22436.1 hypothetical protein CGRA01v4_13726 [Colletotrichum graminicola]